jgi:hypothetical protein
MWLSNDGSDAPNIPSGKGKRLIVLHAGARREGFGHTVSSVLTLHYQTQPSQDFSEQPPMDFQTTQEREHYSSSGDSHHPLIWPETLKQHSLFCY